MRTFAAPYGHLAVRRGRFSPDVQCMTWWEWTIVAIWGPATLAVAGMLCAVAIDKFRKRLERRRPVMLDRRRPELAWLRDVVDGRVTREPVGAIEHETPDLTVVSQSRRDGDRRSSEAVA
jgi:hypothetical protein